MGRAINQDNRLDNLERRLKLVEDALEEMVQTRVHHVDLHDEEEFTPPAGKRKKTTKRKTATVEESNAEA
jgi:hypothetical protein